MKGASVYLTKNKNTRPLKDLVRESIFNLLIHSSKISFKFDQANILDLYAGTGSFGLECISRDAESVFFIENEKDTIEILEKNIRKLKIKEKTKILPKDVFKLLKKNIAFHKKFNLIFCDPPFKLMNIKKLIELIFDNKCLDKNGIIILHRNKTTVDKLPEYFEIIEERKYGMSKIIFGRFIT